MAESGLSSEVNATTVLPEPSFTFSNGWKYRKELTIDSAKVDGNLSDWPLLVHLDSDSDLAGKAQSDGSDIRFEDASGTKLSHEIESYDSGTGTLWAHVKLPSVSASSDTTVYVYYGNSSASNQESVADVWSNGYEAVYHLDESASGTGTADVYTDSTANNNDGDDYVSASGQGGQIYDGQEFDGVDDEIDSPYGSGVSGSQTISAWIQSVEDTNDVQDIANPYVGGTINLRLRLLADGTPLAERYDGSNFAGKVQDSPLNRNQTYHLTGRYNSTADSLSLLVDGSQSDSVANSASITNDGNYYIGLQEDNNNPFSGLMDEVRFASVARSDAWLSTTYANQNDPISFYTVGSEEADGISVDSNGDVLVEWANNDDSSDGGIDVQRTTPVDWPHRKAITIDSSKVDADLSDWPLLVHLDSDSDLAANAQSSGDDIKFENSSGTQLSHEIESYDSSTGTLWAHVKLPSVSASSDTTVYVYYGNDSASNQESVADVWTNGYEAVYHLDESASGTGDTDVYKDSTGNNYHGDDYVSASGQGGQIYDGQEFDGVDDRVETTYGGGQTGDITISAWINSFEDTGSVQHIANPYNGTEYNLRLQLNSDGSPRAVRFSSVDGLDGDAVGSAINRNQSYYIGGVRDTTNSSVSLYVDGTKTATDATSTSYTSQNDYWLGLEPDSQSSPFSGWIDEVRFASVARSDAWVSTSYANQNAPLSFYSVGSQEDVFTFSDVATGLSPSTTSYTDTTISSGETYKYRIERNTDHATATSGTTSITTPISLILNSTSESTLSQSINAIFALSQTSASTTSLSNAINGIFTLSLDPTNSRIGDSRLGDEIVGQPQSFEVDSNLSLDQNAIFSLSKVSQSDSSFSANIIRARVINASSTSVSTFEFILSEDSYAEQYGRELGNAEIDTVVEGDAELDIIVVGNASVD